MTTRPPDRPQTPKDAYENIIFGLEHSKHRVIYNKTEKRFQVAKSDEIDTYHSKDYIKNLDFVTETIKKYITEHGIKDPQQQQDLKNAFKKRATELKERWILWGDRSKRDDAVELLEAFPSAIDKAAETARRAAEQSKQIPTNVPPSTKGPQQEKPSVPTRMPPAPGTELGPPPPTDLPPPLPKSEVTPQQQKPPQEPPSTLAQPQGGPPPPPSTPMQRGGPPPPPVGRGGPPPTPGPKPSTVAKPKATQTHQRLTKEQPLFENEKPLPKFEPGHDLGKYENIPKEKRLQYAAAIEQYLEQNPPEIFETLKKEIKENAKDVETLKGKNLQYFSAGGTIDKLTNHIKLMEEANDKGLHYIRHTNDGKPITLVAQSEIDVALENATEAQNSQLQKDNLNLKEWGIPRQIERDRDSLQEAKEEESKLEKEISDLEQKIANRKMRTNNNIPFDQWEQLISLKEENSKSLQALISKLRSDEPVTVKKEEKPASSLDLLFENSPWVEQAVNELKNLSPGHQVALKSNPEQFFKDLQ